MVGTVNGGTQGDGTHEQDVSPGDENTEAIAHGDREAPTRDDLFEALGNRRRRYTLHYLQQCERNGMVEIAEVSTQVAAWELGTDPAMVRYDDRKNVHTALYQFHAPKLDELGLIEYDKRSGTVGLTPAGSDLRVSVGTDGDGEDAQFMPLWGAFGVSIVVLATGVSVSHVGAVVSMTAALAMGAGYLITANHSDDEERWQGVVVEHPPPPVSED